MVGMSGKSSEPRRGQSAQAKKQLVPTPPSKPQPSAEALQMARMLGDKYPSDLGEKLAQVRAVVPGRSEEEVCIALHDHDFDPEKAITALLDSDGGGVQGEWTTTGRKGKKKSLEIDLIISPGDTKGKGAPKSVRGTNKAVPLSAREAYGGSVRVSSESGRGRGRGRSQSSGRGRSSSGRRSDRSRPPGRSSRVSAPRERARAPADTETTSSRLSSSSPQVHEEPWDSGLTPPTSTAPTPQQQLGTEVWGDSLPVGPSASASEWEQEGSTPAPEPSWQSEEPEGAGPRLPPVFPEAIPSPHQLEVVSTAESTSTTNTSAQERQQDTPPAHRSNDAILEFPVKGSGMVLGGRTRQKRIARSQIPTKPVEMPACVDALDIEFGSLGVDFVGLESELPSPTPPPGLLLEPSGSSQLESSNPLLAYSAVQHFSDDPGVISMSASVEPYQEPKLEAPPGLTHPSEQQEKTPSQLLPPEPISLPQPHPSPPLTSSEPPLPVLTAPLSSHEPVLPPLSSEAALPPLSSEATLPPLSAEAALPPLPQSIELPRHTSSMTMASSLSEPTPRIIQTGSQLAPQPQPHSFSVTSSTTELLLSSSQPRTSTTHTSTTSSKSALAQHTGPQGKHVHPANVMYPQMMHQYPFGMMPVSPFYDPADMNRYPASVSVAYYPSSSDPSVAGGITRDHSSSVFSGDAGKFARGTDVTSPVVSSQQQTQQQQGGLQQGQQMGPAYYPYIYPGSAAFMYPMAGFQAPSMPKPSGGSSYPGGSSFQAPAPGAFGYDDMASGGGHDFHKMYGGSGLGKGGTVPSTSTASELGGASFKHQGVFDSKSGSSYGYSMPMGGSGNFMGGYMGVPMHHMPVVAPHDSSQTRGQLPKHSNKSYGGQFWQQGTHTS